MPHHVKSPSSFEAHSPAPIRLPFRHHTILETCRTNFRDRRMGAGECMKVRAGSCTGGDGEVLDLQERGLTSLKFTADAPSRQSPSSFEAHAPARIRLPFRHHTILEACGTNFRDRRMGADECMKVRAGSCTGGDGEVLDFQEWRRASLKFTVDFPSRQSPSSFEAHSSARIRLLFRHHTILETCRTNFRDRRMGAGECMQVRAGSCTGGTERFWISIGGLTSLGALFDASSNTECQSRVFSWQCRMPPKTGRMPVCICSRETCRERQTANVICLSD